MVSSVPELALVRGDEGLVVGQRVDVDRLAVDVDQRDAGRRGRVRHRLGGRGVDRVDDDRVDARGDEVVDLVELLGDVVLRVLDLQVRRRRGSWRTRSCRCGARSGSCRRTAPSRRRRLAPRPLPAIETTTAVEARRFLIISSAERPPEAHSVRFQSGRSRRRSPTAQGGLCFGPLDRFPPRPLSFDMACTMDASNPARGQSPTLPRHPIIHDVK